MGKNSAVLRADGRDFVYLGLMFIQLDFRSYDSGIPYDVLFFGYKSNPFVDIALKISS